MHPDQENEDDQRKLEALRAEAQKGLDDYRKGNYTTLRTRADIQRFMDKIASEIDEEITS